jgi:deoxyribodipyrimidine photo-lyase
VLPVYVAEPEMWRLPYASARQGAFVAESLAERRRDLAGLGAPLVLRVGDAVAELERLRAAEGITDLVSHEEIGNAWTYARDLRIAAWAREARVAWTELPQRAVVRPLASRDGWARRRERVVRDPVAMVPALRGLVAEPGRIPAARDLGMAPDPCPGRQSGGRRNAEAVLASFLAVRGRDYRSDMSTPVAGEHGCSRLSAHLARGTISVREVAQALLVRQEEARAARDGWAGSLRSFSSRLAWRDHFSQKLASDPSVEVRARHRGRDALRPREPDRVRLAAWAAGETGLPFLDACVRYARATGWLNFRMRAMVQAVASYHLWLDWRAAGPVTARLWTDYDPGIHRPQTQMQSGTTGMDTPCIHNPVEQGCDQDPTGAFTRRWVPELAAVPDRLLQEPWLWDGAPGLLGRGYPHALVDVRRAAAEARALIGAARRSPTSRAEAERVRARHGSLKPPAARGEREARAARPRDRAQASLEP